VTRRTLRPCLTCGCATTGSRCNLHAVPKVPRDRRYRDLCATIIANATTCALCGEPFTDLTDPAVVDHILPRARGGTDEASNLQAAHQSCNAQKGGGVDVDRRGLTPPGHPAPSTHESFASVIL